MIRFLFFLIFFKFGFDTLKANNTFRNLDVFELQYVRDPQISPDGTKIVYVRTEMDIMKDGRTSSLWIINSDGTNHQKLTSNTFNESNPVWSPDGKRISFISSSDDGNGSEILDSIHPFHNLMAPQDRSNGHLMVITLPLSCSFQRKHYNLSLLQENRKTQIGPKSQGLQID